MPPSQPSWLWSSEAWGFVQSFQGREAREKALEAARPLGASERAGGR